MTFSDSDLAQLKEWLEDAGGPTDWKTSDSDKIRALLARLETAEAALTLYEEMDYIADKPDDWENIMDAVEAWRQTCGRTEK